MGKKFQGLRRVNGLEGHNPDYDTVLPRKYQDSGYFRKRQLVRHKPGLVTMVQVTSYRGKLVTACQHDNTAKHPARVVENHI